MRVFLCRFLGRSQHPCYLLVVFISNGDAADQGRLESSLLSHIKLQADRDMMSRLGLVAHLEIMRANGMGIQNIEVDDCAGASSAALRVWEDSNFPYRCDT